MDAGGVEAHGAPFRPFDAAAADTARGCGLRPTGPGISERAVHWRRMNLRCTFHDVLFRKPAP